MANKRHKLEEIVCKLRNVEVLVGQGTAHVCAHLNDRTLPRLASGSPS